MSISEVIEKAREVQRQYEENRSNRNVTYRKVNTYDPSDSADYQKPEESERVYAPSGAEEYKQLGKRNKEYNESDSAPYRPHAKEYQGGKAGVITALRQKFKRHINKDLEWERRHNHDVGEDQEKIRNANKNIQDNAKRINDDRHKQWHSDLRCDEAHDRRAKSELDASERRKELYSKIKNTFTPRLATPAERAKHGENIKAVAKTGAKLLWGLGNQVAHDKKTGQRLSQHPDQVILGGSHPDKVMTGRSRNGNPLGSGNFRSELGTPSNGFVGDLGTPSNGYVGNLGKPSNGYVGNLGKPSNGFVSALGSPSDNPYSVGGGRSTFNWSLASPARSNNARKKGGSYSKKNRGTSNPWNVRI